jgi:hypothetical protein
MKFSPWLLLALAVVLASCEQSPSKQSIFESQVKLNTSLGVIRSPAANEVGEWSDNPNWRIGPGESAAAFVAAVRIDEALLEAAANYAFEGIATTDTNNPKTALVDLKTRFLWDDSVSFLIMFGPTGSDWWGYHLENYKSAFSLLRYGATENQYKARKVDDCYFGERISLYSPLLTCLVVFPNKVESWEPNFRVIVNGLRFEIKTDSGAWLQANNLIIATFRFENGIIPLESLVEQNVPWAKLQSNYILRADAFNKDNFGKAGLEFIGTIIQDIVSGMVLHAIKL